MPAAVFFYTSFALPFRKEGARVTIRAHVRTRLREGWETGMAEQDEAKKNESPKRHLSGVGAISAANAAFSRLVREAVSSWRDEPAASSADGGHDRECPVIEDLDERVECAGMHSDAPEPTAERPVSPEDAAAAAMAQAALQSPPVEPIEHLVTQEDIDRGERVGRKRGQDPKFLQFFLTLNAGLILTAVAIVLFKTPNHFAFGGTSGVSVILSTLFPHLPVGAFMWIINIILVVLGFIFLERKTIIWSVFASFALSAYVSLFEILFPGTQSLTGDMWLDLCMAVILPAVGSAMVFDIGASTGGTDILAMILQKHSTMEIGRALMFVDVGIVCIAACLYGPRVGLYCVLGLFAKTLVVDKFIESIHLRKVCTIICRKPLTVEKYIVRDLNRTATISRAYGAFSGELVTVIMCVLSRREAVKLRRYTREVDPGAFITIVDSSEIVGKGFRGVN